MIDLANGMGPNTFLDVKLTHEYTGRLDYTVYRKPTRTDRYPNFRSDHPLQHKKSSYKNIAMQGKISDF